MRHVDKEIFSGTLSLSQVSRKKIASVCQKCYMPSSIWETVNCESSFITQQFLFAQRQNTVWTLSLSCAVCCRMCVCPRVLVKPYIDTSVLRNHTGNAEAQWNSRNKCPGNPFLWRTGQKAWSLTCDISTTRNTLIMYQFSGFLGISWEQTVALSLGLVSWWFGTASGSDWALTLKRTTQHHCFIANIQSPPISPTPATNPANHNTAGKAHLWSK